VKLVHAEVETPALRTFLLTVDSLATCALARTEVLRACRRTDPTSAQRVEAILEQVTTTVELDPPLLREAGWRSLMNWAFGNARFW
jgi:hypothetical protein